MNCLLLWHSQMRWKTSPSSANSITMLQEIRKYNLPKGATWLIKKCLLVGRNEWIFDGGENSNFVERILLLAVRQRLYLDLFKGVVLTIFNSFYAVNRRVGSVPYKLIKVVTYLIWQEC